MTMTKYRNNYTIEVPVQAKGLENIIYHVS